MDRQAAIEFIQRLDKTNTNTINRAKSSKKIEINGFSEGMADIVGSEGEVYHTTLSVCSCVDWTRRKDKSFPCKHQIAVARYIITHTGDESDNASILSVLDEMSMTEAEKKKAEKPVVSKPESKSKKGHTLAFCIKDGDDRYERLCELSKSYGYANVNSLCYDIVMEWIKRHDDLKEIADKHGETVPEFVTQMIRDYLEIQKRIDE